MTLSTFLMRFRIGSALFESFARVSVLAQGLDEAARPRTLPVKKR
jgi:hypothetical protein